ncbi:allantoate permease [Purpureocillium lavendulum]|uniref:Allantoate permease n=1 Tax=Purpureocillium lavendulum TaxID=1247861 RepID=A0AB34FPP0_9HYPO|nr:allantoate permease [Purpureocillium lavendulum]
MTAPAASAFLPAGMLRTGGTTQRRLLRALDGHDSLWEFLHELSSVGAALASDPTLAGIAVAKTVSAFTGDAGGQWELAMVVLSMHKSMIRSIVLGSVAYDDCHGTLKAYPAPAPGDTHSQGVYVIGLRRKGESGKFLTRSEASTFIDGLQTYLLAARASALPAAQHTAQDLQALDLMRRVDNWHGKPPSPGVPRWACNSAQVDQIESLIGRLKDRIAQMSPTDVTERMMQSPLYVGCSSNLVVRLKAYDVARGFKGVNKPLSLSFCLLEELDMPVELVVRVALRTWKSYQLSLAEQAVATMASSMVYQGGFNAMQAGGQEGEVAGEAAAKNLVLLTRGFVSGNLAGMSQDMERRAEFLEELGALKDDLDRGEQSGAKVETIHRELGSLLAWDAEVLSLTLEKRIREHKAEHEQISRMNGALQTLLTIEKIRLEPDEQLDEVD